MGDVIYIVVFVVLFVVIRKALKEHPLFEKRNGIMSLCVSLLCIIGMRRMFAQGDGFDVILLPYVALGISILFVLLFMLISKFPKKEKPRNKERRSECKASRSERNAPDRIRKV